MKSNEENITPGTSGRQAGELLLVDELSLPLVNRFYKACRYPAKAGRGERVYCFKREGQMLAAVKLMPKEYNARAYWFLRAMCVLPELRGQGIGLHFLQLLSAQFDRPVYCYPFAHLEGFYACAGFRRPLESELPQDILAGRDRLNAQGKNVLLMTAPGLDKPLDKPPKAAQ